MRDDDEETMESWSEEKLKEVVEKKHGELNKQMPTTEIVSLLLFLEILNYFVILEFKMFTIDAKIELNNLQL